MVDGATGISDIKYTRGHSDAAWLAAEITKLLSNAPTNLNQLIDILNWLSIEIKKSFFQEIEFNQLKDISDEDMPSACLGIIELNGDSIEIACIGDISIAIQNSDGIQVISDTSSAQFGDKTLAQWKALHEQKISADLLWEKLLPTLRKNRESVNQVGGYGVIHPHRDWSHMVTHVTVKATPETEILMATDGFWRLIDIFHSYTPQTLFSRLLSEDMGPISKLLEELRTLEREDVDHQKFNRIKTHDDASALFARLIEIPT